MLNQNKVALSLGAFAGFMHAVWSALVWLMPENVQWFLDWIFEMHHLVNPVAITEFSLTNSVMLVITTFAMWFVFGWVFFYIHNWIMAKK